MSEVPAIRMRAARWSAPQIAETPNAQTHAIFVAEGQVAVRACTPIRWTRPTDHDSDRALTLEVASPDGEVAETPVAVGAGRVRGLILHKLIEEVLNGEIEETPSALRARSELLIAELAIDGDTAGALPDPVELAATAQKTLALPEIAPLRQFLAAEVPVYSSFESADGIGMAMAGRVDALATLPGSPPLPIDWKSDAAPTATDIELHASQLGQYLHSLGAPRGALVYMTTGLVHWVSAKAEANTEATT